MPGSMTDYLDPVVPYLPTSLVSASALSRVHALARTLPALSMGGFECRLGARQSRVDFHVGFLRNLAPPLSETFRLHPAWQFVEAFCKDWVERDSLLYRGITNLILEFDIRPRAAPVPVPAVFMALESEGSRHPSELIALVVGKLGVPRASALRASLRRCLDGLPAGAGITHLGAMASRSTELVRLNVGGIAPDLLPGYLQHVGWAGPAHELDAIVRGVTPHVDYVELAVDVSDTVCPRIGLECFLQKQPLEDPRWPALLDHLMAAHLCTRAKREALLSWPGVLQRSTRPETWPHSLASSELFLGDRARSVFVRRLNHVKLVYEAGHPVEAKAYLSFGHHWIDRALTDPVTPRS